MIQLAESNLMVSADAFEQDPMILNVENGTIDLRTQELRPHESKDRLLTLSPVSFDSNASCPRWTSFVDEIFGGNADLTGYFQRVMGYMLTGSVREQALFVFHGDGANGKSTVVDIIESLLGTDLTCKAEAHLVVKQHGNKHPAAKAELFGKRVCHLPESAEDEALDEAQIKTLTGGERIQARFMGQDFFRFNPTHKLVLCTNHKPRIEGQDLGIRRRVKLIPFLESFTGERCDPDLLDKLKAELPGILNWALAGTREWLKDGLNEPNIIREATEEYLSSEDSVGRFIEDACQTGVEEKALRGELFRGYKAWCAEAGEKAKSNKAFYLTIEKRGHNPRKTGGQWYFQGLRLVVPASLF
jgi:putative DNA primase/helicase